MVGDTSIRPLYWVGSSRRDLSRFPQDVRQVMGFALWLAQNGGKHPDAKPLRGLSGPGVLEILDDHDGDTFRAVYTVRFHDAVYVLHAFQKKAKKGVRTPKREMELVRQRLRQSEIDHAEREAKRKS